jgi:hypothetical protein
MILISVTIVGRDVMIKKVLEGLSVIRTCLISPMVVEG